MKRGVSRIKTYELKIFFKSVTLPRPNRILL